jgi:hypothetical protein
VLSFKSHPLLCDQRIRRSCRSTRSARSAKGRATRARTVPFLRRQTLQLVIAARPSRRSLGTRRQAICGRFPAQGTCRGSIEALAARRARPSEARGAQAPRRRVAHFGPMREALVAAQPALLPPSMAVSGRFRVIQLQGRSPQQTCPFPPSALITAAAERVLGILHGLTQCLSSRLPCQHECCFQSTSTLMNLFVPLCTDIHQIYLHGKIHLSCHFSSSNK